MRLSVIATIGDTRYHVWALFGEALALYRTLDDAYARDYPHMTGVVRVRAAEISHLLEPHPFDDAFDGQYHASHAEIQVAELAHDQPIAVSREMCEDCQGYFQRLADYRSVPLIVRDPSKTFIFVPGGVTIALRHR